jgi:hypothetical protein
MSDDRFEDFVRRAAQGYHRPPETPREAMWARIVAERVARRQLGHRAPSSSIAGRRWVRWGLAAAAVLALGIGIGRGIGPRPQRPFPGEMATAPGGNGDQVPAAFGIAAQDHLRHVETFLTVFQYEAGAGMAVEETAGLARNLLMNTRLLMDSPAGRDVHMAALLDDVEVMLAQIASYADNPTSEELRLINEGLEQRGLLLKLRAAAPAEYGALRAQGVL